MRLAIVGMGMVSPAGMTPRDHVFFIRAGVVPPTPSPFVAASGEPIEVRYCPWIGARASVESRLARMTQIAIFEAMSGWEASDPKIAVLLCMARPRPGLQTEHAAISSAVAKQAHATDVVQCWGDAGAFAALRKAEELLSDRNGPLGVLIVAADTLISTEAIAQRVLHPPSPWNEPARPASEAAAAVLVTSSAGVTRTRPVGFVHGAAIAAGTSNDDNDDVVDGTAMTTAVHSIPGVAGIARALGQERLDALRWREWNIAAARLASRFTSDVSFETLEREVGRLGAASGLMSLAYGFAVAQHAAIPIAAREAPFLAWAISPDGTRGVALAQGAA